MSDRLTNEAWRNFDPWECCGQDKYCKRGCHEEGGCANGCIVPKMYAKLAKYEDIAERPEDVQKVKHGKWIKVRYRTFICSCCKRSVYLDGLNVTDKNETILLRELYPYCHCGAKMDLEEK